MQARVLPQYSYTGTATDKPLMQWLQDYTFPRETSMQDLEAAASQYQVPAELTSKSCTVMRLAHTSSRWQNSLRLVCAAPEACAHPQDAARAECRLWADPASCLP